MRKTFTGSCVLLGVVVAFLSATTLAEMGDLEYAKSPPMGQGIVVRFVAPQKVPVAGGRGTLVSASGKLGDTRIKVALARLGDRQTMRLDMTGKGEFRGAPNIPVKTVRSAPGIYQATIGPSQVVLKIDGRSVPVTIAGEYAEQKGKPTLAVTVTAAVEGTCTFGQMVRKVRIVDATGNLSFADTNTGTEQRQADLVHVADKNGLFDAESTGAALGGPMRIEGKWYTLAVTDMKVQASPANLPMGKIVGKGGRWQVALRGRKYSVVVDGDDAQPVEVPADTYKVMACRYYHSPDKAEPVLITAPRLSVVVEENKTVVIPMVVPIKGIMAARVSSGSVAFSVERTDATGGRITRLINGKGKSPNAPAIEVIDKKGNIVYTAQLKYG